MLRDHRTRSHFRWLASLYLVALGYGGFVAVAGGQTSAPAAPPVAATPTELPATIPKGEVLRVVFAQSKIFPGTVRDVFVYIPRQYDGQRPACVYVNQDRVQFKAPEVFDRLIHEKAMPVTIGIFVQHGRVPARQPELALDRFNRSFEYDGLGDPYARFLLNELLPFVQTLRATDGRPIRLSDSGNDRAIGGSSSGAICAFTAAWERPDAFTRVFSSIGTYVGLRGGHHYPTLIRKTEPKPIRIFLEDGKNDLNIYGGDWWIANQAMERSLVFAGYEVDHFWGDGGHDDKTATKIFPDAMRFLWKDWPKPVQAGRGSTQLQELLLPGAGWELVGQGYQFTEGPVVSATGEVYFCDVPKSKIYKLNEAGKPVEWCADSLRTSGLAFGPDGTLYGAGAQGIYRFRDSGQVEVYVGGFSANDLVVASDGTIYATNPNASPADRSRIQCIREGKATVVDTGLAFANGVTLSPDQSLLYVADSRSHWVYSYQRQADGTLQYKQKYYHLHMPDSADDAAADGMRTDTAGRLWVTSRLGLQVCDQAGRVNAILPLPNGECSNLTFAGPQLDRIVVTARDRVYRRSVKAVGVLPFAKPIKPAPPRL